MTVLCTLRHSLAALLFSPALALGAGQHAITLYGEGPKYPASFTHFDYVNPEAPKGGQLRLGAEPDAEQPFDEDLVG